MATSASTLIAPPPYFADTEHWKRQMGVWALQAHQGHLAINGQLTCNSGTAQTVITDARIGSFSNFVFSPRTANAAAELATLYVSSQSKGAATIAHSNAATGDRTFRYCILG